MSERGEGHLLDIESNSERKLSFFKFSRRIDLSYLLAVTRFESPMWKMIILYTSGIVYIVCYVYEFMYRSRINE